MMPCLEVAGVITLGDFLVRGRPQKKGLKVKRGLSAVEEAAPDWVKAFARMQ